MTSNKLRPVMLFGLFGSLVFLNCMGGPVREFINFDTETFYREWEAWESQGLINYSVEEDVLITPGVSREIARIVVRDNAIIQKETLDKWESFKIEDAPYYIPGFFNEVRTISEIYVWVNRVYEKTVEQYYVDGYGYDIKINIIYNEEFHYPEYVRIKGRGAVKSSDLRLSEFIPLASEAEE